MVNCRITAVRRTQYPDLMKKYENPLENPCDIHVGDVWITKGNQKPEGFCDSAWETIEPFVTILVNGGGNFCNGWMKDEHSAMVSCNDGFRPVSFYIELE